LNEPPQLVLVTSTRWPYLRDIIDLMFLQSGLGYRFRYSRDYVQPSLFENPKAMVGRTGYVVHVHTSENLSGPHGKAPRDSIHEFLPVREVTIRDVKPFGDFIWMYFEVGDWVYFTKQKTIPNEHHQAVFDSIPPESRNSLFLTLYEAPGLKLDTIPDRLSVKSEDVTANWIRIVDNMARFPDHKSRKPTYLKLISVRAKDCTNPVFPVPLSESESGYELRSDKDYRMEIFQYNDEIFAHGVPPKPFPLKLVIDKERIVPLVDEATIVGKYDFLTMHFRPSSTLRSYGTTMGVEVETESEMRLTVKIHARVLRGLGQLVASIAVAGGIGLASLASGSFTNASYAIAAVASLLGFVGFYYGGRIRD